VPAENDPGGDPALLTLAVAHAQPAILVFEHLEVDATGTGEDDRVVGVVLAATGTHIALGQFGDHIAGGKDQVTGMHPAPVAIDIEHLDPAIAGHVEHEDRIGAAVVHDDRVFGARPGAHILLFVI